MRDPISRQEVSLFEGATEASPVIRGAPKLAKSGGLERKVFNAALLAPLIQGLGVRLVVESAALEKHHASRPPNKLPRKSDSCGARADNAEICLELRTGLDAACVSEQPASLRRRTRRT